MSSTRKLNEKLAAAEKRAVAAESLLAAADKRALAAEERVYLLEERLAALQAMRLAGVPQREAVSSLMAVVVGPGASTAPNSPSPLTRTLSFGLCVPSNASARVSGAGVSKVNGFYAVAGTCGDRTRFKKVERWRGGEGFF